VILGAIGSLSLNVLFGLMTSVAESSLQGTVPGLILYTLSVVGRWLALAVIPVTILISVARYRLWDVDLVIGRAAVIGAVTLILGAIFLGALLLVQRVAGMIGSGDQSGLALAVASLAVAILFNPTRARLQTAIDARFFPRHITKPHPTVDTLTQPDSESDSNPYKRPALTGEQFAGFTIVGLIGRGGMGEVYRAHQTGLNRDVAIKILAPGLEDEGQFRARFEREGRTLASLNHPNIVKVFDAGEYKGTFYIAMEFIEGESLARTLAHERTLTLDRALPILRGVASALDHAHLDGVIHRDVKPHNIMLQRVNEGECVAPGDYITFTDRPTPDIANGAARTVRPILMDFGIARLVAAQTALTAGAGALGTLDYIAPEQIIDTSRVDGRADQYRLAVVTYQLLTGRLPFNENNVGALIMSHMQKPAPDARAVKPEIPDRTALALLQAMAKRPDDRYESVGAFVEALA